MRVRRRLVTRRRAGIAAASAMGTLAVIQAIPYGRTHSNPPVTLAASFPDSTTRHLFREGCQSCHSNLTRWPWYSNVAPVSWLVMHDVGDGRARFDVSEWDRAQPPAAEVVHAILSGAMPPIQYKAIHGEARLTTAQRRRLADGIRRLYAHEPPRRVAAGRGG